MGKTNGHTVPAEAAMWEAKQQMLKIAPASEPEVLSIPFREWIEEEETLPNGKTLRKRKRFDRTAEIDTFVPASVIYQFFAEADKIPSIVWNMPRDGSVPSNDLIMEFFRPTTQDWIYQQVLNVWQLSEPDMTLEHLKTGIQFEAALHLWRRIFAGTMLALMIRPPELPNKQE